MMEKLAELGLVLLKSYKKKLSIVFLLFWVGASSGFDNSYTIENAVKLIQCSAFNNFYAQINTSSYEAYLEHDNHLLANGAMAASIEIINKLEVDLSPMLLYGEHNQYLFAFNAQIGGKIMETNIGQKEIENCNEIKEIQINIVNKLKDQID